MGNLGIHRIVVKLKHSKVVAVAQSKSLRGTNYSVATVTEKYAPGDKDSLKRAVATAVRSLLPDKTDTS